MIINLTTTDTTPSQSIVGVVDLPEKQREILVNLLTNHTTTDWGNNTNTINIIISMLKDIYPNCKNVMVSKMPNEMHLLQSALNEALSNAGYARYYAYNQRVKLISRKPDGNEEITIRDVHDCFVVVKPTLEWLVNQE